MFKFIESVIMVVGGLVAILVFHRDIEGTIWVIGGILLYWMPKQISKGD